MHYKISPNVLYQELSGESVLLDLSKETYFGLNEVGTRVWSLLGEGQDSAAICKMLENEYEVDPQTLCADVEKLLEHLLAEGLIAADESHDAIV